MNNIKIGNAEISLGNLLLMIGGLLMIISIFFAWTIYSWNSVLPPVWHDVSNNGMDLISGKLNGNSATYSFMGKAPLFMLILGIASLVLGALPLFKVDNKGIKIAGCVVALVAVVFGILYLTAGGGANLFTGNDKDAVAAAINTGMIKMKLGFGSIFGLIVAIVAFVGGILNVVPLFKK